MVAKILIGVAKVFTLIMAFPFERWAVGAGPRRHREIPRTTPNAPQADARRKPTCAAGRRVPRAGHCWRRQPRTHRESSARRIVRRLLCHDSRGAYSQATMASWSNGISRRWRPWGAPSGTRPGLPSSSTSSRRPNRSRPARAPRFGLHRTVARSHLEKLAQAGLVAIGTRRNPRGGRPAKVYSATNTRLDIQVPPRRYRRCPPCSRALPPTQRGLAALAEAVAPRLRAAGGDRHPGGQYSGDGRLTLGGDVGRLRATRAAPGPPSKDHTVAVELGNCRYPEVAREHPAVVCLCAQACCAGCWGPTGRPTARRLDRRRRRGLRARVRAAGLRQARTPARGPTPNAPAHRDRLLATGYQPGRAC